jgi:uroporphyrinogen-III synthase
LNVDLNADQPTARSLAQSLARHHPKKVVWSQAQDPLPDLRVELRAQGIAVIEVPTYSTTQATLDLSDRASLLACHVVTVASPSAVTSLAQLGAVGEIPPLVSIGPTTTAAAHDAGFQVLGEAETPSLEAMVDAVVACGVTLGARRIGR